MPAVTTLLQFTFRRRIQPFDSSSSSMGNRFCNQFTSFFKAIRRLRIQTDGKEDGTAAGSYLDRPSEPDCIFYIRTVMGIIANHHVDELPERVGKADCVHSLHVVECDQVIKAMVIILEPVVLNMVGLPMRQELAMLSGILREETVKCQVWAVLKPGFLDLLVRSFWYQALSLFLMCYHLQMEIKKIKCIWLRK
ncbi:hypothetical protein L1987_24414 [Smallanthus sonchifolius]|uniref:Uncharacterized protein n=1 Tax=Smallanthus sonchifolius TaxID=185202 RepID=A0ACB9IJL7_9ASTR|nr:hypothetical protein L1987_24414 [Smallanthus sonchifolius]